MSRQEQRLARGHSLVDFTSGRLLGSVPVRNNRDEAIRIDGKACRLNVPAA